MGLGLWDENASKTVPRGPAAHLLPTSGEGRGGYTLDKQNNDKRQADHLGKSENSRKGTYTPRGHTDQVLHRARALISLGASPH